VRQNVIIKKDNGRLKEELANLAGQMMELAVERDSLAVALERGRTESEAAGSETGTPRGAGQCKV
jgi:hypothetical protein